MNFNFPKPKSKKTACGLQGSCNDLSNLFKMSARPILEFEFDYKEEYQKLKIINIILVILILFLMYQLFIQA